MNKLEVKGGRVAVLGELEMIWKNRRCGYWWQHHRVSDSCGIEEQITRVEVKEPGGQGLSHGSVIQEPCPSFLAKEKLRALCLWNPQIKCVLVLGHGELGQCRQQCQQAPLGWSVTPFPLCPPPLNYPRPGILGPRAENSWLGRGNWEQWSTPLTSKRSVHFWPSEGK